jgi:S-adenosylmethionine hydrolase
MTDFGTQDAYVGTMKGVMLRFAPASPMIDLTHEIAPQNVRHASFVLWTSYKYFPQDTVFLVVVDPGVGSSRHPVAIRTPHGSFVGPDNGVFAEVLAEIGEWEAVAIDPALTVPEGLSMTFHGRDLFAPTAARLAAGTPLDALGQRVDTLIPLQHNPFRIDGNRIHGELVYNDHFGNLVSNIGVFSWEPDGQLRLQPRLSSNAKALVIDPEKVHLEVEGFTFNRIASTYSEVNPGEATLLINSAGQLEIAVNQGSAVGKLGLAWGTSLTVELRQ